MSRALVIGVGARRGVAAHAVLACVGRLLAVHGVDSDDVAAYSTAESKAGEPGIRCAARGRPLLGYPVQVLARVVVPSPSGRVARAVGTGSVAEAAALHAATVLGAGAPAQLVGPKLAVGPVTAALARIRTN